ncbi:hypothetical protein EV363DRAFT_1335401 [Boletus edulis]|nr:hypothetical protein EV363DRAFT_1335401 [Boletus edulis]
MLRIPLADIVHCLHSLAPYCRGRDVDRGPAYRHCTSPRPHRLSSHLTHSRYFTHCLAFSVCAPLVAASDSSACRYCKLPCRLAFLGPVACPPHSTHCHYFAHRLAFIICAPLVAAPDGYNPGNATAQAWPKGRWVVINCAYRGAWWITG